MTFKKKMKFLNLIVMTVYFLVTNKVFVVSLNNGDAFLAPDALEIKTIPDSSSNEKNFQYSQKYSLIEKIYSANSQSGSGSGMAERYRVHKFSTLDSPPIIPSYQVYTVAGNGILGQAIDGALAASASVNYAEGIFLESTGYTLFLADSGNKRLRTINLVTGITNIFAGDSTEETTGNDGPATSAKFILPYGVVGSRTGLIYVSDYSAHTIRKIDLLGIITLYGGTSGTISAVATASNGDGGPATSATITSPRFIAMDSSNNLYLADYKNKIRKITSTSRVITTVVGTGETDSSGDSGYATAATINLPFAVFVDSMARIFVTEYGGNRIRIITTDNIVYTFAGSGSTTLYENVPATSTGINSPSGIWGNTVGDIFYMDVVNFRLRAISAVGGIVNTIAGNGVNSGSFVSISAATAVPILTGRGVCEHSDGRLFYSDDSPNPGGNVVRGMYQQTQAPSVVPSTQPSFAPTVPVYTMYTVAGNGIVGVTANGAVATSASINQPESIFVDSTNSNIYFADANNFRFRRVNVATGISYVFAGTGVSSTSSNGGQASNAALIYPFGICATPTGIIFISDRTDKRIRKVATDGIISTYAGTTQNGYTEGVATSSQMRDPGVIALDSSDNLYIVDNGNFRVRKVSYIGNILSSIAGNGGGNSMGDNSFATSAQINNPIGLFVDSVGKVYVTEMSSNKIRMIALNNIITTIIGNSGTVIVENVAALSTGINSPRDIWGNTVGDLYFADCNGAKVRVRSAFSGLVNTVAGNGVYTATNYVPSGDALSIAILTPNCVFGDSSGRVYISDWSNLAGGNAIRVIYSASVAPTTAPTQLPTLSMQPSTQPSQAPTVPVYQLFTVAGNGVQGEAIDGAIATSSSIKSPDGVFVDTANNLYLADVNNYRIRKVNMVTGITAVFAGSGGSAIDGDGGQASSSKLKRAVGVCASTSSNIVFITDCDGRQIRKVSTDGIITLYAGTSAVSVTATALNGDGGAATSATFNYPCFSALDSAGNLYVPDFNNFKLRKINTADKIISTIAGIGVGSSGADGGPASATALNYPVGVFINSVGKIYVTEYFGQLIRIIATNGIITTLLGNGGGTTAIENAHGTSSGAKNPCGIWGNTLGDIYLSDQNNFRIRVVSAFSGLVNTIGGNGGSVASSFVASGPALATPLVSLSGVSGDSSGRVYFAGDNAVRGLFASTQSRTMLPSQLPTVSMQPSTQPSQAPTLPVNLPVYQTFVIAGDGLQGSAADGAAASSSRLSVPYGLFLDAARINLFIADGGNYRVRKVNLVTGITNVFAGDGTNALATGTGAATSSTFSKPVAVSSNAAGIIFVVDQDSHCVRRINTAGTIITVVGGTTCGSSGDTGQATSAKLCYPAGIAVDSSNNMYVTTQLGNTIRKVNIAGGIISRLAGTDTDASDGNGGFATSASIKNPLGVFADSAGRVYVTELSGNRVRVIGTDNKINHFAGLLDSAVGGTVLVENVPASATGINSPRCIWGNTMGDIFFADDGNYKFRIVRAASGLVNTIAGNGASTSGELVLSGAATSITILSPEGIVGDVNGNIFISDKSYTYGGNSVRGMYLGTSAPTISPSVVPSAFPTLTPTITMQPSTQPSQAPTVSVYQMYTVAGNGVQGSAADGAVATSSSVRNVEGVFVDTTGNNLYFSDANNFRVRKINLVSGVNGYFAFIGIQGYAGDNGQATSAGILYVRGVWGSTSGVVFIVDSGDNRVRAIATNGIVTTYAGTGSTSTDATSSNGDGGPATSATFNAPHFISLDSSGNLYITDLLNYKIRKVHAIGQIVKTFAGTGSAGTAGDSGQATAATFNFPLATFVDSVGKVYVTEYSGNRVRVIDTNGIIATLVGTPSGSSTLAEDVPGTSTGLLSAVGIWGNTVGDIFYVDNGNFRVRVLSAFSGLVNTIAGSGASTAAGFVSSGPALSIPLLNSCGLHGSRSGQIYISDYTVAAGGSAIRAIYASTQSPTATPTLQPSAQPSTAPTVPAFSMYTIAGNGIPNTAADAVVATSSSVYNPQDLCIDTSNNLYFADTYNSRVRKVSLSSGISYIFAGNGNNDPITINAPATSVAFGTVVGGAAVTSGTLSGVFFVSDSFDHKIRMISTSGFISNFAGTGTASVSGGNSNGDGGPASSATLKQPNYIAIDSVGNLYITDLSNNKVRKVSASSKIITTVAGGGSNSVNNADGGYATAASFYSPGGVFVDSVGNLFFVQKEGGYVRFVDLNGIITSIVGGGAAMLENVSGSSTSLARTTDVWGNTMGDIFFTDNENEKIRVLSKHSGLVNSISSVASNGLSGDGYGRIFFSDRINGDDGVYVKGLYAPTAAPTVSPTQAPTLPIYQMFTVAGTGVQGSAIDGVVATSSGITLPEGVFAEASGNNVYFSDLGDSRFRRVSMLSGISFVFVGTGDDGNTGDTGQATSALLSRPKGVCGTTSGTFFITEQGNHRARQIDTNGIITHYAGAMPNSASSDPTGNNGDKGPATSATMANPNYICVDSANNLYIADQTNLRVRKIDFGTKVITTVIGTGNSGYSGDNGYGSSALIGTPNAVFVSSVGKLYVTEDRRVRAMNANNIIITFAGGTTTDLVENVPATATGIALAFGIWGNTMGDIFFASSGNHKLRMVSWFSGYVYSIAGNAATSGSVFISSGLALSLPITLPLGVAGDNLGRVYVVDNSNLSGGSAVRAVYASTQTPSITPTSTPTVEPSQVPSVQPSVVPSVAPSRVPTATPSRTPSNPPTITPSRIPTPTPSATPSIPSITPSAIPSVIPSILPSVLPSIAPSSAPSVTPSVIPSSTPSILPSVLPSIAPSSAPSVTPSVIPSSTPSVIPSVLPSIAPSILPSVLPSIAPSSAPSVTPSVIPSSTPSILPSVLPSIAPSIAPSVTPSVIPSIIPSIFPSVLPSIAPSSAPSVTPSVIPSSTPSILPSVLPSIAPSSAPSVIPSEIPSITPSGTPSETPSITPSIIPTVAPSLTSSSTPSATPSLLPTSKPTPAPTQLPSEMPSESPSLSPSSTPTGTPSTVPSTIPSFSPTLEHTVIPSIVPSREPSANPTVSPTVSPSTAPSANPSVGPTTSPSTTPSQLPTFAPSATPSASPSTTPSLTPSVSPSATPTSCPSASPTVSPTIEPTIEATSVPSTVVSLPPSILLTSEPPSAVPTAEVTNSPSLTETPNPAPSELPSFPTDIPSEIPSVFQTTEPSNLATTVPTSPSTMCLTVLPTLPPSSVPSTSLNPIISISNHPSIAPTTLPTIQPSITPSIKPFQLPSSQPSSQPTGQPTSQPSSQPTEKPSIQPSRQPSCQPTSQPSTQPTNQPSIQPSSQPASRPSSQPSVQPSSQPTRQPQSKPSSQPSTQPSSRPTKQPSSQPSLRPSANPTQPTSQPSSHLSKYTQSPTFAPTWFTRGTFPSNNSISVLFESNVVNGYSSAAQFKIVLPFLRVTPTSQMLVKSGFYDVHINTTLSTGSSYVLYGNLTSTRVSLSSWTVGTGFVVSPGASFDFSSRSVSNAGDINGDGYDDLIIGVPYAARCYVLFGTAQGFVNMTEGFTVFGAQLSDLTGWSVGGAGDVNNDTFADIIIGAPYARNGTIGSGAAHVLYGKRYGFQDVRLDALASEQGFTIFGSTEGDTMGVSVSNAGDVNGDGYDDIVIGALKATASYRGGAYVVYGSSQTQRSTLYLSTLKPQEGFVMVGGVWSYSGYSVSGAGDVNGDRFDDVLIGSVPFKTSFGGQTTYLVYGSNSITTSINLATLNKQQGVVISVGGVVVSGVGDINHDGYDDIMIGSYYGFTGAGFVVFTNITNQIITHAPSVSPTASPTTLSPSPSPSKRPTVNPSLSPTRQPTIVPSLRPTVLQSGPSEPPTEAPTGPTSQPTSSPTVNTEQPTSTPSTGNPSSKPSVKPFLGLTTLPTAVTKRPTLQPTLVPSTFTPTVEMSSNPSFRSRNPIIRVTVSPTQAGNRFQHIIVVGGSYEKHQNESTNYVVDTPDIVNITGHGSKAGDIYTVLPQVNGSLHIEIFNNISDKLNLTSHRTIHSMSDLVITSGSVIISFPTREQRIRLANLTPLDISENNFIFAPNKYKASEESASSRIFIISFSSAVLLLVVLFILYQLFRRSQAYKERMEQRKAGIIALEDNPTRLIIAVNDMYAHFDAYIPNNHPAEEQANNGNTCSSLKYVSEDSKSNVDENSPLNSFETQNSVYVNKQKQQNSSSVFSSGGILISSGSISNYNSSAYNSAHNSGFYDSYRIEKSLNSYHTSQNSSQNTLHSSSNSLQSDFDISEHSDLPSEISSRDETVVEDEQAEQSSAEHSYNDEISMDSDMISMV